MPPKETPQRFAIRNPPQAAGFFIKSVSPDFMKTNSPRPLRLGGEHFFRD
jgi:hypothetical protein